MGCTRPGRDRAVATQAPPAFKLKSGRGLLAGVLLYCCWRKDATGCTQALSSTSTTQDSRAQVAAALVSRPPCVGVLEKQYIGW